jgi:hypothetical protein
LDVGRASRVDHAGETTDIGDTGGSGGAGGGDTGGSGGAGGSKGNGIGGLGTGATGGSTGGSGVGGSAGKGGAEAKDGSSGNPFIDLLPGLNLSPICRECISTKCASAIAPCSYTPSCVAGTACTFGTCSGFSDSACVLKCFNDDAKQASVAETAMQCAYRTCTSECIDPVLVEADPLLGTQRE